MNIRRRVLPRSLGDAASMLFILTIVPLIYWFELWIVLPSLYSPGTFLYCFHFSIGTFILINIVGNFTYTVLCDTSTRSIIMPVSKSKSADGWRFCSSCEAIAPPRSWHCSTCDTCILKRDHHCVFTGCCIGHFNHRYFMMFLLYLFIATVYSFYYNNYFIWSRINFEFPMSIIKMVFPLAFVVFGFDSSIDQIYLMLYVISIVGMCFTGALLVYHLHLIAIGCVAHERAKNRIKYDLGWRQNIIEVFGRRWYLTWILPYFHSELMRNGLAWCNGALISENSKNR